MKRLGSASPELPSEFRPHGERSTLKEYPVKLERMQGTLFRRNDAFPEMAAISDEQMLDFAHFAVDPEHPGGTWVDYRPGHNRSFVFSDNDLVDKSGTNLGKINIKGTGFVTLGGWMQGHRVLPELRRRTLRPKKAEKYKDGMWGLMSLEDAQTDYDNGERLAAMGIRSSRGVAIIKLDTVYYPGQGIVRVDELKRQGVIADDFEPVVYARATGADHRIRDYEDPNLIPRSDRGWLKERKAAAVSDALKRVGEEMGNKNLTMEEYVGWFAETFGKQVGTLHKNGYIHQGLYKSPTAFVHPVDVTLDCWLLDLDNLETVGDVKKKLSKIGMDPEKASGIFDSRLRADVESAKKSFAALIATCREVSSTVGRGDIPIAPTTGYLGSQQKPDIFLEKAIDSFRVAYAQALKGSA